MTAAPQRGFAYAEFEARTASAQARMAQAGLNALLLTRAPELYYYTGFLTRFWESPTRPFFVVLPAAGPAIAVIPSIGAHLMAQTWVQDIRTWQAPDYADDGVSLLADTLSEFTPQDGKIGIADHLESHVHMPLSHLHRLDALLGRRSLVGDGALTRSLRMIKSEAEIAKIRHAAGIADRAFDKVHEIAQVGTPLSGVFRQFQALCLLEGADQVSYLAGGAAQGGYGDVISPAPDTPLDHGDVLMLDTGVVWDGYFCDFDRNFSLGPPTAEVATAHARLIEATAAAFEMAKPGIRMCDLFETMNRVTNPSEQVQAAGRLGHGLGIQLTEWPSIIPADQTPLEEGMVMTLEPCIDIGPGKIMVHEENIVIRADSAEWLSKPQSSKIRVLP